MNKKIRRLLPKIALLAAIVMLMACVLSSCGVQSSVDSNKSLEYWSGTTDDAGNVTSEKKDVAIKGESDWLDTILGWIGTFLGWITKVMPANSYLLTLFVFAIILEIVFLPFSIKQQKNSIKQAHLKPKEMAIRKKYAGRNDQATQQKVTAEIQELYQKENFNPMGGCLPLLLQLPVIIVLYRIVIDPLKYVFGYSSEFVTFAYKYLESCGVAFSKNVSNGTIEILNKIGENTHLFTADKLGAYCSNPEEIVGCVTDITVNKRLNLNIGSVNFGNFVTFDFSSLNALLLLIPVLTFVVYFFSMKINRKLQFQPTQSADDRQQACSNNMMDFTMPLMSVWMTFIVPAAVGVYWIFKSIIGVGKQFIMSKVMPMPKFTEEDYKAAEKEILGKQPKKIQKSENVGKVRSLHHIDDEDYDEKGNYNPKAVEEKEEESAESDNLPENNMTEGATLKDESDKKSGKKNKQD